MNLGREIKFRGKCIETGDWVYGSLISFDEQYKFIFPGHESASSSTFADLVRNKMVMVEPCSVGQYTGLKDKNSVEIYESDLVQVEGLFPNDPFKVWFRSGLFHIGNWNTQGFINVFDFYEVVGNIYDNA